jgi:hypothetical protein
MLNEMVLCIKQHFLLRLLYFSVSLTCQIRQVKIDIPRDVMTDLHRAYNSQPK